MCVRKIFEYFTTLVNLTYAVNTMMDDLVCLRLILLLSACKVAQSTNQTLVNYYIQLINNRTQAALRYEFPIDARIHEATNKFPKGRCQYTEFKCNFN